MTDIDHRGEALRLARQAERQLSPGMHAPAILAAIAEVYATLACATGGPQMVDHSDRYTADRIDDLEMQLHAVRRVAGDVLRSFRAGDPVGIATNLDLLAPMLDEDTPR